MAECRCGRCGEMFPAHRGANRYCVPCGPTACKARRALYRLQHKEAIRLYGIEHRTKHPRPSRPDRIARCWCGNLFVPRRVTRQYCTTACCQRAYRAKLKASRGIVVAPAPRLPPVAHDLILTQIWETMRRVRAAIDAETDWSEQAHIERRERLARLLSPLAVP